MDDKIVDIETRLAFQEDAIQQLSQVVYEQQRLMDALNARIQGLEAQMKAIEPRLLAPPGEEPPPPHY